MVIFAKMIEKRMSYQLERAIGFYLAIGQLWERRYK
jgi:hypothetical protein